jgi:hypothetical protein
VYERELTGRGVKRTFSRYSKRPCPRRSVIIAEFAYYARRYFTLGDVFWHGGVRYALLPDPIRYAFPVAPPRLRCRLDLNVIWLDLHSNHRFPDLSGRVSDTSDHITVPKRRLCCSRFSRSYCQRKRFCSPVSDSLEWKRTADHVHRFAKPSGNDYTADVHPVRRGFRKQRVDFCKFSSHRYCCGLPDCRKFCHHSSSDSVTAASLALLQNESRPRNGQKLRVRLREHANHVVSPRFSRPQRS